MFPFAENTKLRFTYLLATIFLLSCRQELIWTENSETSKIIAVECIITNELKNQSLSIKQLSTSPNNENNGIENAIVNITIGKQSFNFLPDAKQAGLYISKSKFAGKIGTVAVLNLKYMNKEYKARDSMVGIKRLSEPEIQPLVPGKTYKLLAVGRLYDKSESAMYEINVRTPDKSNILMHAFTLSSVDIPRILAPDAESISIPWHSVIVVRKYSLSPIYAQYCRALLYETQWQGGWFSAYPSNIKGNIKQDALGFFACCAVLTDSLLAK